MKLRLRIAGALIAAAAVVVAGLMTAPPAASAQLTEVTGFGANPTGLRMHLYVPDGVPARPAVLVAVHHCPGSGPAFYSGTEFAALADRHKFIVVYPSATRSGSCFDVSSPQALRHDGGGDPVGIVSMVRYVQQRHDADPARTFVTGASSGGMMTNVLIGAYPDVFRAGASFMGVPFGCFATSDGSGWNGACANGQVVRTPQQWGDLVRAAHPGHGGPRPRMQIWHGTEDTTLRHPNFEEQVKQWTNVHGLTRTPSLTDRPQANWTRTRYGGAGAMPPVEAISVQGAGHSLPTAGMAARVIDFFGLSGGDPTTPPTPPPGGPCRVTYTVNSWNAGFTAAVTITNTGGAPLSSWSLAFTLPTGQTITSTWNATVTPAAGQVTARNVAYNGDVAPGASAAFGFQATHGGDTTEPSAFALDGTACTVT
ncbi:extracellular catalytic domain type 1 short-chain-length polyhydroxyalkanoate depolymerase [Nonomuraea aridisoli]|uniref:Esterase n=1 Tax=Nonomuraea aridisoli TaxID=2070368 RepID=A0A2W2DVN8_9ACTN|nr:PHB depolymerase family esterase [Nonomuraea aridisoli]PZG14251.1 esterase [Nonomuraea aridisoli]